MGPRWWRLLENKTVEIWDPVKGRRLHEIKVPKSYFRDSDYHTAGHLLALLGWRTIADSKPSEQVVWFVDTEARKIVREFIIPEVDHSVGHVVRFTPDGKRLILAFDREIRVLDIKTGEEVIRQKHKGGSQTVALSPNGKTIAFGDYELYLWDWESGDEPRKFASGGGAGAQASVFTGDGKSLIVVGRIGNRARTFDVATGRETGSFELGGYQRSWASARTAKRLPPAAGMPRRPDRRSCCTTPRRGRCATACRAGGTRCRTPRGLRTGRGWQLSTVTGCGRGTRRP